MRHLFFLFSVMIFLGAKTPEKTYTTIIETVEVSCVEVEPLENLANQIALVETWDKNLVGDNGRAIGHFQIHAISVREYNNTYGTSYTHKDMEDREIGKEVCIGLLKKGIKMYQKKFGKDPTTEDLARMWNGGIYTGYKKQSTEKYWDRFQERIEVTNVTWDGQIDTFQTFENIQKTVLQIN